MNKIYTLFLVSFLINISISYANSTTDSIGVENNKGKKLIIHKVEAKETYYSIARKYNVNFKDIMSYNDSKFLQIGVIIKVPTEIAFSANTTPIVANNSKDAIEYTIKAKDNLNMLAEKYGTTVDEIKRLNGLTSINLQIGQVLKIPTTKIQDKVNQPENRTIVPINKPVVENKVATVENSANVEHTVKAKENLNLLAEKYGTTVDEIKRLNGLTSNNLRIGQVLKISSTNGTEAPAAEEKAAVKVEQKNEVKQPLVTASKNETNTDGSFEHTVLAGETIYSIAHKYSLTTFQLKSFNNLTSTEVNVGQKLIIKGVKPAVTSNEGDDESDAGTSTLKDPTLKYAPSRYGLTQFEEKGIAVWIADQDLDPSKMLALHRTAPVGTVIKITNPMTNRTTYAKVVGKFTENETTKDVIIVMTKAVADAVGALDKRFNCNITYGAPENEQQK